MREPAALTAILVAGGGLAGAAAACRLARAGRPVTVFEREREPAHKVCGEFLSGEALADLAELGITVAELGAVPITAMRLVHRGRVAESRLPFRAAGLSRRRLDEALLQRAAALGAGVERGVRIRGAETGALLLDGGASVRSGTILLATGKHDVRGVARTVATVPDPLIGFKLHLRLRPSQQAALAGHVELILFDGGYAGLQMVEGGQANLCLLIDRARHAAEGHDWPALLAALGRDDAHLARRLEGAAWSWERPLTIFRVPYGFVHRGDDQAGLYRLGDQAAVIPSFCGDGMAIALHSARLAANAVLGGRGPAEYHRSLRRDAGRPVRLASGLYRATRSGPVRSVAVGAARLWPGLLRLVARRTRVATP